MIAQLGKEKTMDMVREELSKVGRVARDVQAPLSKGTSARLITVTAPEPREAAYVAWAALRDSFAHISEVSVWGNTYEFSVYTKCPRITGRGVIHKPGAFGAETTIRFEKGPGPKKAPDPLEEWCAGAAGDFFGHPQARAFGRMYGRMLRDDVSPIELERWARENMGVGPEEIERFEYMTGPDLNSFELMDKLM